MNDREALEKMRQGGRQRAEAVKYLYRRFAPRFFAYYLKHMLPRRDADALLEETFVAAVRQCDDFFGETRADAWLWGIARSALLDYFRRQRPQEIADDHALELLVTPDPDAASVVAPSPASADCARYAYVAFAAAHADRAEMLSRVAFDGWSAEDLAAALKRNPEGARAYLAQSREKLSVYLEPCRVQSAG